MALAFRLHMSYSMASTPKQIIHLEECEELTKIQTKIRNYSYVKGISETALQGSIRRQPVVVMLVGSG